MADTGQPLAEIFGHLTTDLTEKGKGPGRYSLSKVDEVFTEFEPSLVSITTASPGQVEDFVKLLQEKLDEQIETPPVNKTIERPF